MPLFTHPEFDGHEQVVFCHDAESGLKAIIAIHSTRLGPALGGCRMWAYPSEDEALTDVLRLARGMTFKAALAELPYGGGKSVILADPARDKSAPLFRAMGRHVERLGGRYTIAEDVGISVPDVELMARETRHVAGIPAGGSGDPSPATAYGVFKGIEAALAHATGRATLAGRTVAVQGLGHVGLRLCGYVHEAGGRLIVADLDPDAIATAVQRFGASVVAPDAILAAPADVLAPCALGAVLSARTIPTLRAAIVAGSANNQLAELDDAVRLAARGILYAPDYAINAGGIINISHEGPNYDADAAFEHVARIAETLSDIFRRAADEGITTAAAADRLAAERLSGPALAHPRRGQPARPACAL